MKKLSEVYKELGITFTFPIEIKNKDDKQTYFEDSYGEWYRSEYDENGKVIYLEDSEFWRRYEYDTNGNETSMENNDGFWRRREYDKNGNQTYYEDSYGERGV